MAHFFRLASGDACGEDVGAIVDDAVFASGRHGDDVTPDVVGFDKSVRGTEDPAFPPAAFLRESEALVIGGDGFKAPLRFAAIGKLDVLQRAVGILHCVDVAVDGDGTRAAEARAAVHEEGIVAEGDGDTRVVVAHFVNASDEGGVGAIGFPSQGAVIFGLEPVDEAVAVFEFPTIPSGDGDFVAVFDERPLRVVTLPDLTLVASAGTKKLRFAAQHGDFDELVGFFHRFGFEKRHGKTRPTIRAGRLIGASINPANRKAEAASEVHLAEVIGDEKRAVAGNLAGHARRWLKVRRQGMEGAYERKKRAEDERTSWSFHVVWGSFRGEFLGSLRFWRFCG